MLPTNPSASFIKRNPQIYGHQADRAVSDAKPERDQAPALESAAAREAQGVGRPVVRFTGYRVRPLDPDNFAGSIKDLLDGLVQAKLIPGDTIWEIVLETTQVRVKGFKEERTEIEILTPD